MKNNFHVFSRMFTKMNVFLFLLLALLMVPSAWAATYYENVTTNGQIVKPYCTDDKVIQVNSGVTSFVVATEWGTYNNNCSGRVYLNVPSGYSLSLSGEVALPYNSNLIIYDSDGSSLYSVSNNAASRYYYNITTLYSSGNSALLCFFNDGDYNYNNNFTLNVSVLPPHSVTVSVPWEKNRPWNYYVVWDRTNPSGIGYYDKIANFYVGQKVSVGKAPHSTKTIWGVNVKDAFGALLTTTQINDSLQFTMPASDVTVVPTFSDCSDSYRGCGYNLVNESRTVNIAANGSIKVYDDGGIDYQYANNFDGYLTVKAPTGYQVKVSGSVTTEYHGYDYLELYEGAKGTSSSPICKVYSTTTNVAVYVPDNCKSVGNVLTLRFKTDGSTFADGLNLVVSAEPRVYNVGVNNNQTSYGTIRSDKTEAEFGSTVTLTADTESGYALESVSVINTATNATVATSGGWETNNKVTFTMPAGNVIVTPNFVTNVYSITYNRTKGGELQGNVSATVGSAVEVSAKNSKDSLLKNVQITDAKGNAVKVEKVSLSKFRFIMPIGNVTVTPTWTDDLSAEGGLYINMRTTGSWMASVSSEVKSFKVYDDGGKSGNYSNNANGMLYLAAPEGYYFLLTGNVKTYNSSDYLQIYNGLNPSNADSLLGTRSGSSTCKFHSKAQHLTLKFISDGSNNSSGLDLTVTLVKLNLDMQNDGTSSFVNMLYQHKATLNIPNEIKTFKVYDEGGKTGIYSNNNRDTLVLIAPENHVLKLTGNVTTATTGDFLKVYSGNGVASENLLGSKNSSIAGTSLDIGKMESYGRYMTLYFESDGSTNYAGLDLTVNVVPDENSITIVNTDGGKVNCNIASAKVGSEVNLIATQYFSDGYLLSHIDIVDDDGDAVKITNGGNFANPSATFNMPAGAVTVTPHYTQDWSAAGGLYVNMPAKNSTETNVTIPAGVKSFKVYDDGGVNGYYSNNYDNVLRFVAPDNYVFQLNGSISSYDANDYLSVFDNETVLLNKVRNINGTIYTTTQFMKFEFVSDANGNSSGLNLDVNVVPKQSDIVVNGSIGGNVSGANSAKPNTTVNATITLDDGYLLKGVTAEDENGNPVRLYYSYVWYQDRTVSLSFTMPACKVYITPVFTNSATVEDGIVLNMEDVGSTLQIPAGISSFKFYSGYKTGKITVFPPQGYHFYVEGNVYVVSVYNYPTADGYVPIELNDHILVAGGDKRYYYHSKNYATYTCIDGCDEESDYTYAIDYGYSGEIARSFEKLIVEVSREFLSYGNRPDGLGAILTVSVVPDDFTIWVYSADGGRVTAPSKARTNELVTVTAKSNSGSILRGISVKNKSTGGYLYSVGGWYTDNKATFTMPASAVEITPTFTNNLTAEGDNGLYINIPHGKTVATIPVGVQSFKIYDNGGKGGAYGANSDDTLKLSAPSGYRIKLTGYVTLEKGGDSLYVFDGSSLETKLYGGTSSSNNVKTDIGEIISSDNHLTLRFKSNINTQYAGLDLTTALIPTYKVNLPTFVDGGSVSSDKASAIEGETVTLTVTPDEGYKLVSVAVTDVDENMVSVTTSNDGKKIFSMPNSNVSVTAEFAIKDYNVNVVSNDCGRLESDKDKAYSGDVVTLTATPAEGYLFDGVSVEDADGNAIALNKDIHWYSGITDNTITFLMPANAVTVTPKFSSINDLYVNMPKSGEFDVNIPQNVTSFKIYDDGGENGDYSNGGIGRVSVIYDKNSGNAGLKLSGSVSVKNGTTLNIYAMNDDIDIFYTNNGSSDGHAEDIGTFINSSSLLFEFSKGASSAAGLDLKVDVVKSPGGGVEVVYDDAHVIGNGNLKRWATITDGNTTSTLNVTEDVDVDTVMLTRKFKKDVYSTIVFPFDVKADDLGGVAKVLRFNGFKQLEDKSWAVRMKRVWTTDSVGKNIDIAANTPYLVVMDDEKMVVRTGVTLRKTVEPIAMAEGCSWTFNGALAYMDMPEGNPNVYGFQDNKFVRAGEKSYVNALRAYLLKPTPQLSKGRLNVDGKVYAITATASLNDNPDELYIVEDDDEKGEHTTVVGRYNVRTGEFKMLHNYDLKGRNVGDKANKARGAYYGKKVIK